jgi:restriction system protein
MNPLLAIHVPGWEVLLGASSLNLGGIFMALFPMFLLVMVLSLLRDFLRSPKVKGRIGEVFVSVAALKRLDPKVYRVFNDLVLPRPDGKGTTQIDHVVVSPFGIFVIETKNYEGWIFGDENSRQWTQVIYGKKSRFQNPLHQNALHVRALATATGLPRECFHNLVFFVGDAILKTPLPPQVMTEGLVSYIRSHQAEVIPSKELAFAMVVLDAATLAAPEQRQAHQRQMSVGKRG